MSRVWAMSAKNCFWIWNRRLPMPELPSIKNDKSTLQSEEWKKTLLFWFSPNAFTWTSCSFFPLPFPGISMRREWKRDRGCRSSSVYNLAAFLNTRSWRPVLTLVSITILELQGSAINIGRLQKPVTPLSSLGKPSVNSQAQIIEVQTLKHENSPKLSLKNLWSFTFILIFQKYVSVLYKSVKEPASPVLSRDQELQNKKFLSICFPG